MLIFHPVSNEVKYSYYHALPQGALLRRPVRVLVYLHDCGETESYAELEANVKNLSIPAALKLSESYKYTLLVPVNPTKKPSLSIYTDKQNPEFYDRADAVILKMIKNFLWMLKVNGYTVHQKVFLMGGEKQGGLANLLATFYPDMVHGVTMGNTDSFMYPAENLNDVILNYPYGTYDILKFQPNNYSLETFKKVVPYIYSLKDAQSLIDTQEGDLTNFIKNTFGATLSERNIKYAEFLKNLGMETKLETNVEGKTKEELAENCFKFFESIKTPSY
jgi:hypothetical protein